MQPNSWRTGSSLTVKVHGSSLASNASTKTQARAVIQLFLVLLSCLLPVVLSMICYMLLPLRSDWSCNGDWTHAVAHKIADAIDTASKLCPTAQVTAGKTCNNVHCCTCKRLTLTVSDSYICQLQSVCTPCKCKAAALVSGDLDSHSSQMLI